MRKFFVYSFLAVSIAAALFVKVANAGTPPDDTNKTLSIKPVRLINTAEAQFRHTSNRYGSVSELEAAGLLARAGGMNEDFGAAYRALNLKEEGQLLEGYEFALVVTPNGAAYKLSLVPKKDCGTAYFSGDRGIIYLASALGCSKT